MKFGDLLTEIRDVNSYPTKAKDVGSKLTKLSKKGFVLRTGDKGEYLYELTIAGENEFSRVLSSRSTEDGQSQ